MARQRVKRSEFFLGKPKNLVTFAVPYVVRVTNAGQNFNSKSERGCLAHSLFLFIVVDLKCFFVCQGVGVFNVSGICRRIH